MLDESVYVYIARNVGDKRITCSLLKQGTDLCTTGCSDEYNLVTWPNHSMDSLEG